MILKHNYWYFKQAVPIKTCKKILKAGRKKLIDVATVREGNLDKTARDCKVAWMNDTWIYDILNPFIHTANKEAGWNFQWDWNESSQFTIYEKGHYYGWHTDQNGTLKNENKNINGKTRKLSLTLQLTDKNKYKGGDFQFKWIQNDKKEVLNIITVDDAKDIGTIIIFPSFIHHQILPIVKGKRESLVNWSIGKEFS
tara:strand:+ start:46 stop:636 length:591 start_codon:yes stop_codon:yes gene_type:complete